MHSVLFLLHQTLPTTAQLAAHKSQLPLARGDLPKAPHPGSMLSATGTAILQLKAASQGCASNFTHPQHTLNDPDSLHWATKAVPVTAVSIPQIPTRLW